MQARRVNADITVCDQIDVDDVSEIARLGYRSIVCNRPDAEAPGQTTYQEIAAEAQRLGLETRFQPIVSGHLSDQDGQEFKSIINELEGPALAYCAAGVRCIVLWSLAQAGERPTAEIIAEARAAGFDLTALVPRIDALAQS